MKLRNTKISHWAVGMLLLLFAAPMTVAYAQNPECQLPPPSSVWITDITSNSVTAEWTPVPGALIYRMRVSDAISGLVLVEENTTATVKTVTGLPAGTEIIVGISASACDDPDFNGGEVLARGVTVGYIVGEIIVGRCTSEGSESIPTGTINVQLPHNETGGASNLQYYQARVDGRVNCGAAVGGGLGSECRHPKWSCRFSIVVPCSSTFFVDLDQEEGGSYGVAIVQPAPDKVMLVHAETGETLFTFSNPESVNNLSQHFTDITFESTAGISFFSSNDDGCSMQNPGGLCPRKDRSLFGGYTTVLGHAASLSPNPTSDRVDLQFHLAAASEVEVNLYDAAGRAVQQVALPQAMPEGQNRLALDVSALPPGFYFVRLRSAQGMETLTLVKQ